MNVFCKVAGSFLLQGDSEAGFLKGQTKLGSYLAQVPLKLSLSFGKTGLRPPRTPPSLADFDLSIDLNVPYII